MDNNEHPVMWVTSRKQNLVALHPLKLT
jgi:hypothetical protein